MTTALPVIDVEAAEAGDRAQLDAVRTATEDFGAVQVVNHGVPQELSADLSARMAQEGDYEGLQIQGPDGGWTGVPLIPGALQVFSGHLLTRWTGGRLRPGRHRVVAGGTVTRRSTAVFVYPALETVVGGVRVWDHVKGRVADYLAEYGRPEQVAAWRDGRPYVAELADNSAGQ
jgi:isopenicillin N synthase-like dioxygenase